MKIPQIKDIAVEFINTLHIKFSSLSVQEKDQRIWINLTPLHNTSKLIGYRGQNIYAMQTLLTTILFHKGISKDSFIVFDIDGYQKQHEEKIIQIVKKKIEKLEKYQEPQIMPFLGPQERRMVHLYIKLHYPNYVSESFADEHDSTKRVLKIFKK